MSRAMNLAEERSDPWLLDEEAWACPDRLTDADLFAEAGTRRRHGERLLDDPEDDR